MTDWPESLCLDCGADTWEIDEYYMLRNEVWLEAHPADDGMLCIGCVERRLGRQLTSADFSSAPINHDVVDPVFGVPFLRSARFVSRLRESS